MKKLFTLLLLSSLIAFNSSAQVTITQNDMPHSGDELYRTRANINPFLNYAATGPNHVWNFANITAAAQDSAIYQSVSSTNFVYAFAYADIFLNPNRANHARQGVDIPFNNLLPITDPYTFYYRSNSVYKKVGYGVELAGIPVPIIYTNHDEIYSLPIDFTDTDSSFSSYNLSIPTLAYYGYEQSRTNVADGWGVITTPSGTFDALRVKTELFGRDTINLDTLGLGFVIDRPKITEYKWLSPGYRVPVLQINTTELFGVEVISELYFYDVARTLAVVPPLSNVICPGSTLAISYDATGVFNAGGLFNPANVFRAQLSDATGSFASPVNIGSVTAVSSGVISVTIPANTPAGTGYRIRVIATNPAFTGSDNGFDLTVGAPPVATVTASGVTEFCEGGSVMLSATQDPGYTYQWSLDGNAIPGAVTSDYIAAVSGNYTVTVTNACGDITPASTSVTVHELPEHVFSQASFVSCDGSVITLAPSNTTGQSGLAYQWYQNGVIINGATGATYDASAAGNYSLEITNPITGCVYMTNDVAVVIDSLPTVTITPSGATDFCDGGSVTLDATPDPFITYQWQLNGVDISGATTGSYNASLPGSYSVVISSVNGCTASTSVVNVTVNPLPLPAAVMAGGPLAFCDGGTVTLDFVPEAGVTYQWLQNGNPMPGATNNSLTVDAGGSYTVLATNASGCTSISNGTTVTVNSLPTAPVITALGSTVFCAGGSVVLETPLVAGYTYQWLVDGIVIPGAIANQYSVSDSSGFYSVIATNLNGCTALSVISYQVVVNPLPAVPVVTASYDTLFASGTGPFQWYLDGVLIPGATGQSQVVTANGNYTVTVTDANGCSATSAVYIFTNVGITEVSSINCQVYPNPSSSIFNVQMSGLTQVDMVTVSDIAGKEVRNFKDAGSRFSIDLSECASGWYTLQVRSASGTVNIKLIKN